MSDLPGQFEDTDPGQSGLDAGHGVRAGCPQDCVRVQDAYRGGETDSHVFRRLP